MRKIALYAAALFLVLVVDRVASHAVPAPHDNPCLQCHVSHNMLGTQTDDLVCLTCHNPSGGAKAQTMPFSPGDAASLAGGTGMQTSHNWSGSDTNPAAGAEPPLTPELALKQHEGKMSCAKCHNLHGPRESASNSAPFLRTLNDRDQMCLDCHRSRNTQDHRSGSHPVMVGYTTAISYDAAAFYDPPRSANPANPSAGVKLVQGKVSCSSCHGVHYTDSSSSTFDGHSSAVLGRLKRSDGTLLRTEQRGASADAVNLCTNCHQGYVAHNGRGQNVQCTDCHGAHVATTDGSAPNVWLVRRFMRYSTAAGRVNNALLGKPTYFQSMSPKNYRDANGTGVCQSCHAIPSTVPEHSQPDVNCGACHYHGNTSGAFSPVAGSCTTCHGQPPAANVAGGPNGFAPGYAGVDESLSAHTSHVGSYSYSCNVCHAGQLHASGNYQQVFLAPAGTLAAAAGATPSYNTAARTCATVYCHSNGAPQGGSIRYAAPIAFANGKGALIGKGSECVSCHGGAVGSFNNLSTNAHFRHVSLNAASGKLYGCLVCHAATVAGNGAIADRTKHVNGAKELSFIGIASGTSFSGASCSTSYCHSNGKGSYATVSWTNRASGACGTCHATAPALGSALIASGAHFAHFSTSATSYGPMLSQKSAASCQSCHSYTGELSAGHVNGSVDLNSGLGYSSAGTGTCAPCHQQPVNWNGGAVSCESCHTGVLSVINGVSAQDKGLFASKGHGAAGKGCLSCHDRNQRHIKGGSRLQAAFTGSLNAECVYCHNNAAAVASSHLNMNTHVTVKGGGASMSCAVCHDPHGTSNLSQIRTVINGRSVSYTDASAGLVDLVTNQGLCQVCHTATNHYRAGVPETNHPTRDCLNCHSHTATGAAFRAGGSCDACHGYPPAPRRTSSAILFGRMNNWSSARFEDYSGGGGAHLVAAHIAPNARPSDGWAKCAVCHNSGNTAAAPYHAMALPLASHVSSVTVAVDPRYRFDNNFIAYTGAKLVNPPARNMTGSCSNVSCHMGSSPRWSIER